MYSPFYIPFAAAYSPVTPTSALTTFEKEGYVRYKKFAVSSFRATPILTLTIYKKRDIWGIKNNLRQHIPL